MATKSVNVLGERYKVIYGGRLAKSDYGHCNPQLLEICVDPEQSKDKMRDTLLHEVIHAIDNVESLHLKESQVRSIATGLRAVFTTNPQFAKFVSQ